MLSGMEQTWDYPDKMPWRGTASLGGTSVKYIYLESNHQESIEQFQIIIEYYKKLFCAL